MLPLRDDIPSQRAPVLTVLLIAINGLAFLYELSLGRNLEMFLLFWGITPVRYTEPEVARHFTLIEQTLPFIASMFLHGGWLHLIGNMWSLWIFGDNVEDRLGHGQFLLLYFLGGIIAALFHIVTNSGSVLPTIGASGAVAAVMGAYFRLYPRAHVEAIIPPFIFGPVFVLPAILFLGFWFLTQFLSGGMSLLGNQESAGGIAWWAHIGGFIFGAWFAHSAARKDQHRRTRRQEFDVWG